MAVARRFQIGASTLRLWRRQAREGRRAPLRLGLCLPHTAWLTRLACVCERTIPVELRRLSRRKRCSCSDDGRVRSMGFTPAMRPSLGRHSVGTGRTGSIQHLLVQGDMLVEHVVDVEIGAPG